MATRINLSQRALLKVCCVAGISAIVLVIILELMDSTLRNATGAGIFDLDKAATGPAVRFVLDRWQAPTLSALAGAILGLSYLLIPCYGVALWLAGLFARDLYTKTPGRARRYMNAFAMAPLIAGLCDAVAKALQLQMLVAGPDFLVAAVTWEATILKWAGVLIGILLALAALPKALMQLRRKKA